MQCQSLLSGKKKKKNRLLKFISGIYASIIVNLNSMLQTNSPDDILFTFLLTIKATFSI